VSGRALSTVVGSGWDSFCSYARVSGDNLYGACVCQSGYTHHLSFLADWVGVFPPSPLQKKQRNVLHNRGVSA